MGTRKDLMERKRAMETARNTLYSKIGIMIMGGNKLPDRLQDITVKRMERELKFQNQLQETDMKRFKRNRLIYNLRPTLVVERPPSPYRSCGDETPGTDTRPDLPHYMMPIKKPQGEVTKPPDLPSMDAFVPRLRKKLNLWEAQEGSRDGPPPKFKSLVRNSPDMTQEENFALVKNWNKYRPISREEEVQRRNIIERQRKRLAQIETRRPASPSAFITQMPRFTVESESEDEVDVDKSIYLQFNRKDLDKFDKIRRRQVDKFRDVIFR